MHEHDQDLIMALAEGSLADDAAAAAARAEIADCADCAAELELQVAALAVLGDVPEVYLTAAESARLHSNLKQELSLAAPKTIPSRRSFAWSRLLPAAGVAAALLVVIVSLPSLFGGGSDDSADETIASPSFEAGATETTAAMEVPSDGIDEMAGSDGAASDAAPPAAMESTEAQVTTTTTAPLAGDDSQEVLGALDFLGPIDEVDTAALLDRILSEAADLSGDSGSARNLDPLFAGCLAESVTPEVASIYGLPPDSEPLVLGIVTIDTGAESILVAYISAGSEEPVLAVVSPDCSSIELLP